MTYPANTLFDMWAESLSKMTYRDAIADMPARLGIGIVGGAGNIRNLGLFVVACNKKPHPRTGFDVDLYPEGAQSIGRRKVISLYGVRMQGSVSQPTTTIIPHNQTRKAILP